MKKDHGLHVFEIEDEEERLKAYADWVAD